MDRVKAFSRRSFLWITFFMMMLVGVHLAVFFMILHPMMGMEATQTTPVQSEYMLPALYGAFMLIYGLLIWMFLRGSFSKLLKAPAAPQKQIRKKQPEAPKVDKQEEERKQRRLLLHLLSTLQREGRLLDFFSEDLSMYEDGQIGAAARSIHENCKKALDKYVRPRAVMKEVEGEEIEIPADFDQAMIRLTGNVAGNPPFKGILRHKGWKAQKSELPKLADTRNPEIIAPAEVEIQ